MPELFDILRAEVSKASAITDVPDTWTPVVSVTMTNAEAGIYEFGTAVQATIYDINDSAMLRYSINGGDWYVMRRESKDVTDIITWSYLFPKIINSTQTLSIAVEAAKDVGAGQYDVDFADVWIYRVG
jgi:hypothetical protein